MRKRNQVVYIAGPYRADTVHGIVENVRLAEWYAKRYWRQGFTVICPHKNTALLDGVLPDDAWLDGAMELLRRSDIVVFIPGWEKSSGSRAEMEEAKRFYKSIIVEEA